MATQHIENKLKLLPDQPGCYLMKDVNAKIIYVGKAKNSFARSVLGALKKSFGLPFS